MFIDKPKKVRCLDKNISLNRLKRDLIFRCYAAGQIFSYIVYKHFVPPGRDRLN